MSVKKVVICVIKYVPIPMVRTCVSALMATHWASIELHVLVSPLIILCLYKALSEMKQCLHGDGMLEKVSIVCLASLSDLN